MEKENRFEYSRDEINKMIAESNVEHVAAKAIGDGLRTLKTMLEDFYNDDKVFYFGYELADIRYFNYTPREI